MAGVGGSGLGKVSLDVLGDRGRFRDRLIALDALSVYDQELPSTMSTAKC
jgi:hypothetical protein